MFYFSLASSETLFWTGVEYHAVTSRDVCESVQPTFIPHKSEITQRLLNHTGQKIFQSRGYTRKITVSHFPWYKKAKIREIVGRLHHVGPSFAGSSDPVPTSRKASVTRRVTFTLPDLWYNSLYTVNSIGRQ